MTYDEYKNHLRSQGWGCAARYMGRGSETSCEMTHSDCSYSITISDKPGGVTARATITLPGFMNLISTVDFGSPWSNKAFFNQVRKLDKIKRLIGDILIGT